MEDCYLGDNLQPFNANFIAIKECWGPLLKMMFLITDYFNVNFYLVQGNECDSMLLQPK